MKKLLYIQASPRGERSHSRAVAEAFLASYQELHPADDIVTLDLFTASLPSFDGLRITAKYHILQGQPHSIEEASAWQEVEKLIAEFKSCDKYVMAVPMWNFNIPYRLKQYIDIILQPGYTFSYSPETGYQGLVRDKPIFVAYARGGEYQVGSEAEAFDHQRPYLEFILRFMGFTDIRGLVVEPTLAGGPEIARARREAALEQAREMAKTF